MALKDEKTRRDAGFFLALAIIRAWITVMKTRFTYLCPYIVRLLPNAAPQCFVDGKWIEYPPPDEKPTTQTRPAPAPRPAKSR